MGIPLDQVHDEVRPAAIGLPRFEDLGDVGMVHQGQGLALGLEAGDHLTRVHAWLEDFQGDLAADRLGLLGHEDDAEAPLADLFQQFVRPDHRAGTLGDWLVKGGDQDGSWGGSQRLHEAARIVVGLQEHFDALAQHVVVAACLGDIGRPLGGLVFVERRHEDRFGGIGPHRHGLLLPTNHIGQCDETSQSSQKIRANG